MKEWLGSSLNENPADLVFLKKERKEEGNREGEAGWRAVEGMREVEGQIWGTEEQTHRKKTHSSTQSFLVRSIHEMSVRL